MKLKKILRNRTVKNAGWLIGGRLVNKLLALLVGILTARYLGPGNYGLIDYAAAYVTFFASLCNLGINSVIIKVLADHPEEEGTVIGTTLVLRAVSSFLSAIMMVGIVMVIDRGEPVTIVVVALSSIGLLFQVLDTLKQWFQSRLQSKYAAIATTISYAIMSGYKLVLLMTGKSVEWFALATSVEYLGISVLLYIAYKRNGGPKFAFSRNMARELLKTSSSFIVSGLMVSVYATTDKLMLKQLMDDASVGYYGLAVTLSGTWGFLLQAVIDSVYPSVINAHSQSAEAFARRNRQLYALVLYAAGSISLIVCLLADPIVRILYGAAYLPAVAPLRIVVWYTAFSYLGVARNAWMVCENCQKYLQLLYTSAAVINVVLNWILIPVWGGAGAALASLVTQMSTTVLLPALIKPLRPNAQMMLDALLLRGVLTKGKN